MLRPAGGLGRLSGLRERGGAECIGNWPSARFQARPPACYRDPWRLHGAGLTPAGGDELPNTLEPLGHHLPIAGRNGWSTKAVTIQVPVLLLLTLLMLLLLLWSSVEASLWLSSDDKRPQRQSRPLTL